MIAGYTQRGNASSDNGKGSLNRRSVPARLWKKLWFRNSEIPLVWSRGATCTAMRPIQFVLRAVLSSIWFARTVHKHVGNRGNKAVSELLH